MVALNKGEYFGKHHDELSLNLITLTDTQYTHPFVDWHYHQNAYFTFLIRGELFEANKKESYELKPGALLFHHWDDPHFNRIKDQYTQGFHIEIEAGWFEKYQLSQSIFKGSMQITDPILKRDLAQIYIASKMKDSCRDIAVESLLLNIFSHLIASSFSSGNTPPAWVNRLRDLLHDQPNESYNLVRLSHELNIHPVHLSRHFKKYFHTNLGEYLRMQRLNQALGLLKEGQQSSTAIAYECGFSDQSHFIRLFKRQFGLTPMAYQKNILKLN